MGLFGKKKKKKPVLPKGAKLGDRETLIRKLPNQGKRAITFERKKKKRGKKSQECWVIVNNEPVSRGRPKGSPNKKKKGSKK